MIVGHWVLHHNNSGALQEPSHKPVDLVASGITTRSRWLTFTVSSLLLKIEKHVTNTQTHELYKCFIVN